MLRTGIVLGIGALLLFGLTACAGPGWGHGWGHGWGAGYGRGYAMSQGYGPAQGPCGAFDQERISFR